MNYPDATASYSDSKFVIVGITHEDDEMSFRSGTSEAPDYIRKAAWNYESYDMFSGIDLQDLNIYDAGNLALNDAKFYISKICKEQKIPIILGGAHSLTPVIVSSIDSNAFGVVVFDAHMDFRQEYEGNKTSHACAIRNIYNKVGQNRLKTFGIRSSSKEEFIEAKQLNLDFTSNQKITEKSVETIDFQKIYVSLDMDVFDPSIAPGVSNPEPNGLGYEVLDFINELSDRIIAIDIVEICPAYDNERASILAAKIIRDFICNASKKK